LMPCCRYAIRSNGTLAWSLKVESNIQSSPAIGSGGQIYFASFDGTMYSVAPSNGVVAWTSSIHQTFSSPALGRHGIYIGDNSGTVTAFVPSG
jgi:outer membrane protein assembly factor BamB